MYLFVNDGTESTVNILHILAWSHGFSQRDEIQSQKQPAIAWQKWTNEELIKWLCDSGLDALAEIFKTEELTGKELQYISSEDLKQFNVKLGPRLRFDLARSDLVRKKPTTGRGEPVQPLLPRHQLNLLFWMTEHVNFFTTFFHLS